MVAAGAAQGGASCSQKEGRCSAEARQHSALEGKEDCDEGWSLGNCDVHYCHMGTQFDVHFGSVGCWDGAETNQYQAKDLLCKWCLSSDAATTQYCLGDQGVHPFGRELDEENGRITAAVQRVFQNTGMVVASRRGRGGCHAGYGSVHQELSRPGFLQANALQGRWCFPRQR